MPPKQVVLFLLNKNGLGYLQGCSFKACLNCMPVKTDSGVLKAKKESNKILLPFRMVIQLVYHILRFLVHNEWSTW